MDISDICSTSLSSDGCSCPLGGEYTVFPAAEESLALSHQFLDECSKKHGIPKKTARHIQICSDEIVTNIVSYAHAETIRIHYAINDNAVILTFEDNGILFDPLQSNVPDITLAAKERQIGGLGLFMVKRISSSAEYEEVNGRNRLRLSIDRSPAQ